MKKIISILLSAVLIFSLSLHISAYGVNVNSESYITCSEAAELLMQNSDAYLAATQADILKEEQPDKKLTNAIAAKMILRAFGTLPEPHYLRVLVGYWDTSFEDVPEDCKEAVDNLTRSGLYIPKDNRAFCPDEEMPRKELLTLIDRIHAYMGTSLKDDFCNTVNHDRYYEEESEMGEELSSTSEFVPFMTDNDAVQEWYTNVFNKALNSDGSNADQKNISDFLSTYLNMDMRKHAVNELMPYIQKIDKAKNVQELVDAYAKISNELGVELLLNTDLSDNITFPLDWDTEYNCYYYFVTDIQPPEYYLPGSDTYEYSREQCSRAMQEYGWDANQADSGAEAWLDYCHDVAQHYNNQNNQWKQHVNIKKFDDELSDLSIEKYMSEAGYQKTDTIAFSDSDLAFSMLSMFNDEHLEGLKTYGLYHLLQKFCIALQPKLCDRLLGYYNDCYFNNESEYLSYYSLYFNVIPLLQWNMSKIYVNSPEGSVTKEKVEYLFKLYKDVYRQMLSEVTWMSANTKSYAIKKLDAIGEYFVCSLEGKDNWEPEYLSEENGGTLIGNMIAYNKSVRSVVDGFVAEKSDDMIDKIMYCCGTMVDNAFYIPTCNAFYVPLGSLLDGTLANSDTLEEHLANFGFILGHEITHAFDNSGRLYDAQGQLSNWWTDDDSARYEKLTDSVISLYDGYEYGPGLSQTGQTVVGEAISDNGSMCCSLKIAANQKNFDYDYFFRLFAQKRGGITNRKSYYNYLEPDEHPFGRTRVNTLLSNFDEFYDTYGITRTDGMYLPKDQRIVFWGTQPKSNVDQDDHGKNPLENTDENKPAHTDKTVATGNSSIKKILVKSPNTADNSDITPCVVLLITSFTSLITITALRKRKLS